MPPEPHELPRTLGHLRGCRMVGLFGSTTIDFETSLNGPTLLYGRNGSGKSTVLRIIDDIANARWFDVFARPFSSVYLTFDSDTELEVSRQDEHLIVRLNDQSMALAREGLEEARQRALHQAQRLAEMGRPQAYAKSQQVLPHVIDAAPWLTAIPRLFPVLLIDDQRLILKPQPSSRRYPQERNSSEAQAAVGRYPRRLVGEMQQALSAYAAHSQELDRRFPMKIADAMEADDSGDSADSLADLHALLDSVRAEREALQRVGLLGQDEGPVHFNLRRLEAERVRPVIQAFAEDTLAKFAVLQDIRTRLELFSTFLGQHYRDKTVATNRERGFSILLADGRQISPSQLSSGEQQVLALAFQILFVSQPQTLILIDEPELSLHVVWQAQMIDDLVSMGEARNVTFLLATHSPTLIGGRRHLMRSLDGADSVLLDEPISATEQLERELAELFGDEDFDAVAEPDEFDEEPDV